MIVHLDLAVRFEVIWHQHDRNRDIAQLIDLQSKGKVRSAARRPPASDRQHATVWMPPSHQKNMSKDPLLVFISALLSQPHLHLLKFSPPERVQLKGHLFHKPFF